LVGEEVRLTSVERFSVAVAIAVDASQSAGAVETIRDDVDVASPGYLSATVAA
jgi:hypothetical protein